MLNSEKKPIFRQHIRTKYTITILLILTTLGIYWHVSTHDFINYDDPQYVYNNPHIQKGLTVTNILWAFTSTYNSNWHPVTWLSHMLDVDLFGMHPGGHHLTNLFFHIVNTILLFFLFEKMTGDIWPSAGLAALFAFHPLHVESVAWVSERKDLLCMFWALLSLYGYVRYVEKSIMRRYLTSLLLFSLSLMSKPMAVTLPGVMFLIDIWPLKRYSSQSIGKINNKDECLCRITTSLILEKIPFFILSVGSGILTIWSQKQGGSVTVLTDFPIHDRLSNALVSYVAYLWKMIWPLNLSVFYPMNFSISFGRATLSCLILGVITAIACRQWKQRPYLLIGWLWYLGTLLPVIGLVQVGLQSMADRYTYMPLVGIFLIIAWSVKEIIVSYNWGKIIFVPLSAIVMVVLAVIASYQNRLWSNSITLFQHALTATSGNFVAHANLGFALCKINRDEAAWHYKQALQIEPHFKPAWFNLATSLMEQDQIGESISMFEKGLKFYPLYAHGHNNLGMALLRNGEIEKAISHFKKAVQLDPDDIDGRINLKKAEEIYQSIQQAEEELKNALTDGNPILSENLTVLEQKKTQLCNVLAKYQKMLSTQPGFNGVNLKNIRGIDSVLTEYQNRLELDQRKR